MANISVNAPVGSDLATPSDGVFYSTEGQAGLPRWFGVVFAIVKRIEIGSMEFVLKDGRVFRAQGERPGPHARAVVHDTRLFGRLISSGELGFAEAYVEGWWSTPDLQAFLDVALLNNERVARGFPGGAVLRIFNSFRHWLNRNTRAQARKNIEAHYDLGNDFYRLWLDPSMTYSSALFENPDESLSEGQRNKYRSICDRLDLRQGDHVLEIGCGWGGFAEYAARERGLKVTGLTISPAQLEFAQRRMQREGLNDHVELRLQDYRDVQGQYDGVASIEMLEAVGEKFWPAYFGAVHERLRPGGRASIQTITIADNLFESYRNSMDFIQKYIFPGGMLPSPEILRRQTAQAGLEWVGSKDFGQSYSNTLRQWRERFNAQWSEIAPQGFDARFYRMWNFYLAICASCFLARTTDVSQLALRRA